MGPAALTSPAGSEPTMNAPCIMLTPAHHKPECRYLWAVQSARLALNGASSASVQAYNNHLRGRATEQQVKDCNAAVEAAGAAYKSAEAEFRAHRACGCPIYYW
jgi:hypothetical protein